VFAVLAVALFGLFHGTATILGSDRGQYGVVVALVVVSALLACERMISGRPLSDCAARLGLGAPRPRGLVLAAGLAALLLAFVPISLGVVGARAALLDGWKSSLIGLFAQAGIAEEALFRGFLFRRLRPGRSFRRAVVLSSGPYLVAHLPLFGSLPWPHAAAALGLAAATSVSLARLFESGGWTIWPPAVLHFVVQGTVKVLALDELPPSFPVLWMMASAVLPLLVLLENGTRGTGSRPRRSNEPNRDDPRSDRGGLRALPGRAREPRTGADSRLQGTDEDQAETSPDSKPSANSSASRL